MSKDAAQFVFMTCRAGAEGALKREVARVEPEWHVAFSRPGFLTFKHTGARPLDARQLAERSWTFAHAHGISLGVVKGENMLPLAEQVWQMAGVAALVATNKLTDIHVWQREAEPHDGEQTPSLTPLAAEVEQVVRAAAPAEGVAPHKVMRERRRPTLRSGLVLDIVVVEPGEWWIGYHRAVTLAQRWPGGVIPTSLPEHAVSRAYAKIEEAILWSGLPLAAGDECVEIGCAPGGACQALLDRGMFVTGIDPAAVDPSLLEHPRFRHLRKRGNEVQRKEFLGVRWLAADMNIAPTATLDTVEPIATHSALSIRGLILTLKMTDWSQSDWLPEFAARVRGWGYRDVRLRQLTTGGQEVCLVALRRKALRRLGRKARRTKTQGRKSPTDRGERRRDKGHKSPAGPHF